MPTEQTDSPEPTIGPWHMYLDDPDADIRDLDERIPYALSTLVGHSMSDHPPRLSYRDAMALVGAPAAVPR